MGLSTLAALGLFGGMLIYFNSSGLFRHTYGFDVVFKNAQGVSRDSPVQVAGIQVGNVDTVTLTPDQQARLRLRINEKYHLPRGSRFTITTPILGTTGVVTILPPVPGRATVAGSIGPDEPGLRGQPDIGLTASFDKAGVLIDEVTKTTRKVDVLLDQTTRLVGNPRLQRTLDATSANVLAASANVNAASANGLKLTRRLDTLLVQDNAQVRGLMRQTQGLLTQTQAGSQAALGNITATTEQVRQLTNENRGKISALVSDLQDTTAAVSGITKQTQDLLQNGGVTKNLSLTVANLKATTDKLDAITANVQSLSGDPKIQSNLRDTVQNIRDSTEQASLLLARLNQLAGTKPKTAVVIGPGGVGVVVPAGGGAGKPRPGVSPLFLPRVDLVQNTKARHFRTDIDAIVPLQAAPVDFVRVGIYGFGDTNNFILQGGQRFGPGGAFDGRAGLYASKLSVGADVGLGGKTSASVDLYDPNHLHLDAHGVLMLAPELGLLFGGEDLTHRGSPVVGLEYRRSK